MNDQEILTGLRAMKARIGEAFDEDADKWARDKQLALEDIENQLDALIARIGA